MSEPFDYEDAKTNYAKAERRANKFPEDDAIIDDETNAWYHYVTCAKLSRHCIRWNCEETTDLDTFYCLNHQPIIES